MITKRTKQIAPVAALMLAASAGALAQGGPPGPGRGGNNAVQVAGEAIGLSEEQMEQIREIRRARPGRGLDQDSMQSWRDEQRAKIQAVLTDEQRAKVAELEDAMEAMRALPGAMMLGLVEAPGRGQRARVSRGSGPGGARGGWNRGRDRGRNPRFAPRGRGGPNRGRGADRRWRSRNQQRNRR